MARGALCGVRCWIGDRAPARPRSHERDRARRAGPPVEARHSCGALARPGHGTGYDQLAVHRSAERISWNCSWRSRSRTTGRLLPSMRTTPLTCPEARSCSQRSMRFEPESDVLEIACGPGFWTGRLLRHATTVTSLDAASEMLAIASARIDDEKVRFIQADVFSWRPDRRYDVVLFGFWLSHVPAERFQSFWSLLRDCLAPHGRVFFADDAYRTPEELIEGGRIIDDSTAASTMGLHTVP